MLVWERALSPLKELVPEVVDPLLRDCVEPPVLIRLSFGDSLCVPSAFVEEDGVVFLEDAEIVELRKSRARQSGALRTRLESTLHAQITCRGE